MVQKSNDCCLIRLIELLAYGKTKGKNENILITSMGSEKEATTGPTGVAWTSFHYFREHGHSPLKLNQFLETSHILNSNI